MRVALADDSGIMRTGLTRLLEGAGVEVRYAAKDGAELLTFMTREQPDAVVVDVRMPPDFTEEGLQVAEQIKALYPLVGVLVLSTYGVLGRFRGVAVHHAWAPYDTYLDVDHQLCCAHALRELAAVADTAPADAGWCWATQAGGWWRCRNWWPRRSPPAPTRPSTPTPCPARCSSTAPPRSA